MAPNFDNNIALFARGVPKNLDRRGDKLVSLFCELLVQDSRAMKLVNTFRTPDRDMIGQCVKCINIPVAPESVITFVMNGSKRVLECIQELT